jgi:5-deoxy-glucuronate isomerase
MAVHLVDHRDGFGMGFTPITTFSEPMDNTGIAVGVWKMAQGEQATEKPVTETAWLLMEGQVQIAVAGKVHTLQRLSLFDEGPSCIHVPAGADVLFKAETPVEFTVYRVENSRPFDPTVHYPHEVDDEPRGKGTMGNTCTRFVRTIFDGTSTHENSMMVLGEVITLPGRWSSYPPHHHPQPEIYHYRFDQPQGFGHAELGDDVLKVKHNDTVKIFPPNTHSQCAAPGYAMYYSWVIRHLPGDRYTVPIFEVEHSWARDPDAPIWRPDPKHGIDDL